MKSEFASSMFITWLDYVKFLSNFDDPRGWFTSFPSESMFDSVAWARELCKAVSSVRRRFTIASVLGGYPEDYLR